MDTLAPTVHERLARCATSVDVDGIASGADVVLSVGGVEQSQIVAGDAFSFAVPPLAANAVVKAKQDTGAGFSPWSPEVVVEDAGVPPKAVPRLPDSIGNCSECVMVDGLVPECGVELRVGAQVVGQGVADSIGSACVGIDLSKADGNVLSGLMKVCGKAGPLATTPLVKEAALPKPVVGGPLFGCQEVVPLSNLHPGAPARVEMSGTDLGSFCSCWNAVNVFIGTPLVTGKQVRAQQFFQRSRRCEAKGPWSDWQPVVAPDDRIRPTVLDPLIEGDQVIRVSNQIPGASLVIRIRPAAAQPPDEFGPRPAGKFPEIGLNAPLQAGNVVTVVQTLCSVSRESDPVTVQPKPPVILAPVVMPPLFECAAAVQVSNVYPGALVRIYEDGIPIGLGWAGEEISINVAANPSLTAPGKVTAKQWLGGTPSPMSKPVPVQKAKALSAPRILEPVANGDALIWVSSVMPGARVSVESGGSVIGSTYAAEPIVRVAVSPVNGPVNATVKLCAATTGGPAVNPITEPGADGIFANSGESFRSYPDFAVPPTTDGDAFASKIQGQLYFPSDNGKDPAENARNLPLVIIAHGYWSPDIDSYKGYDYLARHLARWGMVVFSVSMNDVNDQASVAKPHQYSRGEIILHTIDAVAADPLVRNLVDRQSVGLIGHSMAGEGVEIAQHLNVSGNRGFSIRGVVSIAPTNYHPDVILRHTKYMQLLGSTDLLVIQGPATGPNAIFGGFQLYDRAWRPKTHFWIRKARHNPFNRQWVANGDHFESGWAAQALPPEAHERIAKCLINAFFQDALRGQAKYAGYMQGTILPHQLADLVIHTQHSQEPRVVLDNFGDSDEQVPLAAIPLNRAVNRLGQAVNAAGAGLTMWQNVDDTTLAHSPHQTDSVQVSWNQPDVHYSSATGGLAVAPTDVFALRISQFFQDNALNPTGEPLDLYVELSDGVNTAAVRLGAVAQVPFPESQTAAVYSVFETVRLPFDAFHAVNPALNLGAIRSVHWLLVGRATGNILADDLELGS
jgi:hypothetical protein